MLASTESTSPAGGARSHVVAANLVERASGQRTDHLLAPDELEVGVVHRLGHFARGVGGGGDGFIGERLAGEQGVGRGAASGRDATAPSTIRDVLDAPVAIEPGRGRRRLRPGKSNEPRRRSFQ